MDISELFTKKNIEILHLLEKERLHIRDIAQKLDISPARVSTAIQLFGNYGLVKEYKDKNRTMITLNQESTLLKNMLQVLGSNESSPHETTIRLFDTISPLDFRYYGRNEAMVNALQPYLSENALIKAMVSVEIALTNTLAKKNICTKKIAQEIEQAAKKVTADEVYREEDRLKHNVRALVNCIRNKVSEEARPYIHFTTTSHDIVATADAYRYKEFTNNILLPSLIKLEKTLIELALREKNTLQIGRTHGQHAVPITFGFAIAQYVSRLGHTIVSIRKTGNDLRGKIAGAVGSYNASSLFFDDPEEFERMVLAELNLKPSPISTQIPEHEYMVAYVNAIVTCFGVLANLSDDMRHLQRSEIGEVGEAFAEKQVGSSTMPQKRNPINFENVKSMWKEMMPRMITLYSDQISEHQRDLTNSASLRFVPEILTGLYVSITRINKTMSNLVVDKGNLKKNFDMNKGLIVAEPLYILLAAHGHPSAHETVRLLTLKSQQQKRPLQELILKEKDITPYVRKFSKKQLAIIKDPSAYTGIAGKKTQSICMFWKKELGV